MSEQNTEGQVRVSKKEAGWGLGGGGGVSQMEGTDVEKPEEF